VGMGTLFAGIIRAPLTSVFMIFEITQDYQILVPLMVANLLSFLISRRFQPMPVYHALLQQDHVHLPSAATRAEPSPWTAADVMGGDFRIALADASLQELWEMSRGDAAPALLVGTPPGRLLGMVRTQRLEAAVESGGLSDPASSIIDSTPVHAHPDHPSEIVLERMAEVGGLLPIVSREDAQHVLGVVTFSHIMQFMRKRQAPGAPTPFE
jgi:CIC family chloride channel protein